MIWRTPYGWWLLARLLFGIALACEWWELSEKSAQLMGMLP